MIPVINEKRPVGTLVRENLKLGEILNCLLESPTNTATEGIPLAGKNDGGTIHGTINNLGQ